LFGWVLLLGVRRRWRRWRRWRRVERAPSAFKDAHRRLTWVRPFGRRRAHGLVGAPLARGGLARLLAGRARAA
jgi:hypothetical protein